MLIKFKGKLTLGLATILLKQYVNIFEYNELKWTETLLSYIWEEKNNYILEPRNIFESILQD